ncbi:MAG: hypothetical protein ABGZ17_28620 [Planctomycetaceae bacterium]|jgi:hypothetical protein
MLKIAGLKSRYCDGVSRRTWMQIGSLGLGGMALPQMLQAESENGGSGRAKGIIMVLLPGGPPHLDMYDLKPDAPTEIRGGVSADLNQRPRHRNLRADATSGGECRQVHLSAFVGGLQRRP